MADCIQCGEIVRGRADKKFCGVYCRTSFHNQLNGERNNYMRRINRILCKNRRILSDLKLRGLSTTNRSYLLELGFQFQYFTHFDEKREGLVKKYCYDLGYIEQGQDLTIIEKQL